MDKQPNRDTATLLLTIPEAATELRVSENSLYRLISAGAIETTDVGTGRSSRTRVTHRALEAFVEARTSKRSLRAVS